MKLAVSITLALLSLGAFTILTHNLRDDEVNLADDWRAIVVCFAAGLWFAIATAWLVHQPD